MATTTRVPTFPTSSAAGREKASSSRLDPAQLPTRHVRGQQELAV